VDADIQRLSAPGRVASSFVGRIAGV
jgi:hypothetical protein